jgi:hypothetical protein
MTTDTTVRVKGYTTCGSVRGQSGRLHRTREAAGRDLARDQRGCRSAGGYSDRSVVVVGSDGYLYRDESCREWVPAEGGRSHGAARFVRE